MKKGSGSTLRDSFLDFVKDSETIFSSSGVSFFADISSMNLIGKVLMEVNAHFF